MNTSPESSATPAPAGNGRKNPYTLWFVIISFSAPVILAYGMYFLNYTPSAYSNLGELLNPVVDVEALSVQDDAGNALDRDQATLHKWNMVYFATAQCDEACATRLLELRQVNRMVGKNAYRLRRMIVHLEQPDAAFAGLLEKEYPDARRVYATADTARQAMQSASTSITDREIFLMDPIGNIMMRYTGDAPYKWLVDDLNKLFKVSQIG